MGYSRNPVTLRKIADKLEPLARGQSCSWTVTAGTADRWAYRVREGLAIAYRNPDKFPALARVAKKVKVEIITASLVQATIEETERGAEAVLLEPGNTTPVHGVNEGAGPSRTLVGAQSAAEVIEFMIRAGASNDPIRLPNANLSEDAKQQLQTYAQGRTPAWVLLEPTPGALSIVPSTPDIPSGAIWKRRG